METAPVESIRRLIDHVYVTWHTYDKNSVCQNAAYDIRHLRDLARAAMELADTIVADGLPPPTPSPASEEDQRLARKGHLWAERLSSLSDTLLNGEGHLLMQSPVTMRPIQAKGDEQAEPINIRCWLSELVSQLDGSDLLTRLSERHRDERVVQLKANLIACFDHCKRHYNQEKPRKLLPAASEEQHAAYQVAVQETRNHVREAFGKLLPAAIRFPLTEKIQRTADNALELVLKDRGEEGRLQPAEAAVPVVQAVISKYLAEHVSDDRVRQGASLDVPCIPPSAELQLAQSLEEQATLQPQLNNSLRRSAAQALPTLRAKLSRARARSTKAWFDP